MKTEPCHRSIRVANGEKMRATCKGVVVLHCEDDQLPLVLDHVYYVPQLPHNLLSMSQLEQNGATINF
ncbi:TPA: hypothetical protein N0F65_009718 [Lagenidium giganteum]|uniref:Retrovirus-related Pol polyprotein from transposon TNT 1-94-like beta-barrel domain-containing protein n=1 Tax=Lagenidium giganteum TaxID=4803 RepID=A0AAV2YJ97_9STRA|nr:TPA: hypothetical protein N0F65_009718 [Lagenidium giganteum]